jgi:hypothetical protein
MARAAADCRMGPHPLAHYWVRRPSAVVKRQNRVTCPQASAKDSGVPRWKLPWPFPAHGREGDSTEIVFVSNTEDADEVLLQEEEKDAADAVVHAALLHKSDGVHNGGGEPDTATSVAAALQQHGMDRRANEKDTNIENQDNIQPLNHQPPELSVAQSVAGQALPAALELLPQPTRERWQQQQQQQLSIVPSGYWQSTAGGWAIAAAVLLAIRLGRQRADAERLDVRALQARQQESRVQVRHDVGTCRLAQHP